MLFTVYKITRSKINQAPYLMLQPFKIVTTPKFMQKTISDKFKHINNAEKRIDLKKSTLSCQIYLFYQLKIPF